MNRIIGWALLLVLLPAGCPSVPDGLGGGGTITARISISATRGPAPLRVTVSGADSSSLFGGIQYAWDFAGLAQFDTATATYIFTEPGLYPITLRVRDLRGQEATARQDVRVAGAAPTAVIRTDVSSGPVPLPVHFDATGSSAPDDVIRDYLWDFGDRTATSPGASPLHVYQMAGDFTVTLKVTTAGGVEDTATATISVGARSGSLQFDGGQQAVLKLPDATELAAFTWEAWCKAGTAGGALVTTPDGDLSLELRPGENTIRVRLAGQLQDFAAPGLAGIWRHVALSFDGQSVALYLDGSPGGTAQLGAAVSAAQLNLGIGFVGKMAEVRLWSSARSAAQISGSFDHRLTGSQPGLLGYWRLDEGSGQVLGNQGSGGSPGTLGASTAPEASDPAWSTDAPPLE